MYDPYLHELKCSANLGEDADLDPCHQSRWGNPLELAAVAGCCHCHHHCHCRYRWLLLLLLLLMYPLLLLTRMVAAPACLCLVLRWGCTAPKCHAHAGLLVRIAPLLGPSCGRWHPAAADPPAAHDAHATKSRAKYMTGKWVTFGGLPRSWGSAPYGTVHT